MLVLEPVDAVCQFTQAAFYERRDLGTFSRTPQKRLCGRLDSCGDLGALSRLQQSHATRSSVAAEVAESWHVLIALPLNLGPERGLNELYDPLAANGRPISTCARHLRKVPGALWHEIQLVFGGSSRSLF